MFPFARRAMPSRCPLGQRERRVIFQEMVRGEMNSGGRLRRGPRSQLARYALKLGIPSLEAELIIADVEHTPVGQSVPDLPQARRIRSAEIQMGREKRLWTTTVAAVLTTLTLNVVLAVWILQ